jgi:hypothetical protein
VIPVEASVTVPEAGVSGGAEAVQAAMLAPVTLLGLTQWSGAPVTQT